MLKIDYILLIRHFQEKTFEEENLRVTTWREKNIVNDLTYNRLKKVYHKDQSTTEEQKVTKDEIREWEKIISKILKEKTEK